MYIYNNNMIVKKLLSLLRKHPRVTVGVGGGALLTLESGCDGGAAVAPVPPKYKSWQRLIAFITC